MDRMITFVSVHHSIQAEQKILEQNLRVEAIPTPRQVEVSCGQALLFQSKNEGDIFRILHEKKIRWSKLFRREMGGQLYEQIGDYEDRLKNDMENKQ